MYQGLIHFHSMWRYVALAMLLVAVIKAITGWLGKKDHSPGDEKLALFAMISLHVQLLSGLVLYAISPAVNFGPMAEMMKMPNRFWTVEHIAVMIVATMIITIGRKKALKAAEGVDRHKKIAISYLLGLLIIFFSIPWPWSSVSRAFLPF